MSDGAEKKLAAIDIGTNSIHFLLVSVDARNARFKVLDRDKEMVRLGMGAGNRRQLSADVMNNAMAALKRFKQTADAAGADVRALATSAVREASNSRDFVKRAKSELNLKIEIASGFEEARLTYLGILQAVPVFGKRTLIVDIGGGSTEFLIGERGEILYDNSVKMGAVRYSQRFFPDGTAANDAIQNCRDHVAGTLTPVLRDIRLQDYELTVGSSGTIVAVARMIRAMQGDSGKGRTNGLEITHDHVKAVARKVLSAKSVEDRRRIPGLESARADIVVAGIIILEQIFDQFNLDLMTVSDFALREGIVMDTIEKRFRRTAIEHDDIRYRSVIHLAEHYKYERDHAHQTAKLALRIFDQTESLHKLGELERGYLESAAILHEIGSFVSHAQHHHHSYYLIKHAELLGFTENEIEIIAQVARYHRKSRPKSSHAPYEDLAPEDQLLVCRLAAILRIADGLDRTHTRAVSDVNVDVKNGVAKFTLIHSAGESLHFETWGANQKKELFEDIFDVDVTFDFKEKK